MMHEFCSNSQSDHADLSQQCVDGYLSAPSALTLCKATNFYWIHNDSGERLSRHENINKLLLLTAIMISSPPPVEECA